MKICGRVGRQFFFTSFQNGALSNPIPSYFIVKKAFSLQQNEVQTSFYFPFVKYSNILVVNHNGLCRTTTGGIRNLRFHPPFKP